MSSSDFSINPRGYEVVQGVIGAKEDDQGRCEESGCHEDLIRLR
jgi:hypothetical protein